MSELREEAASIAHALRRKLERERALGGGELLAAGVARARREAAERGSGIAKAARSDYTASAETPADVAATAAPRDFLLPPPDTDAPMPRRAAAPTSSALDTIELPPFSAALNPSALGRARDAIAAAAQPVLEQVGAEARVCIKCGLSKTRTNAVPGVGSALSGIVFVGEAPGADEDLKGEPFVGRAGQLLTEMIAGMNSRSLIPGLELSRETVYIINVLKCRPPENRDPLPHEIEACSPYLLRQLEALQPRVICCLGKFAAEMLLGMKGTIAAMRGKTYRWKGAKLIVTYHPAYCLRSPSAKRPVWEDLQRLAKEYLTD